MPVARRTRNVTIESLDVSEIVVGWEGVAFARAKSAIDTTSGAIPSDRTDGRSTNNFLDLTKRDKHTWRDETVDKIVFGGSTYE
jgi:hypothetical protein